MERWRGVRFAADDSPSPWGLPKEIFLQIRTFVSRWDGVRASPGSLIVGRNTTGKRPPLFWVFQGEREFLQLSSHLLEPQSNGVGGEVPTLIYSAAEKKAYAISGMGWSPAALTIDWCREQMANYKVPRHVWLVDDLPLNASNKVLKQELRAQAGQLLAPSEE